MCNNKEHQIFSKSKLITDVDNTDINLDFHSHNNDSDSDN